jgi:ketosteroid isomerase-like protein
MTSQAACPSDAGAAREFAAQWVAAWNSHDLDRILIHYADLVEFRSRKAARLVDNGLIRGKSALRAYWAKALETHPDLRFELGAVFLGHGILTLTYRTHLSIEAAETFEFGEDWLVIRSAACHAN